MNCNADKIFVFALGAMIGSFLNVCIHRMPLNESIVFPSSHCPKCNRNIRWYDNIPILSFLILAGKCRHCGARISLRYPAVELLTALILTVMFITFGLTPKFFAYSLMTCALIVIAFVDLATQDILIDISRGALVAGVLLAFAFPSILGLTSRVHALLGSIAGALAGGLSIFILTRLGNIIFRGKIEKLGIEGSMGSGDIELMAMIGAFLGWKLTLLTFFIAPFFGAVPGIIAKFRHGEEVMPYGPFLSMAALVSVFFGNKILSIFSGGIF